MFTNYWVACFLAPYETSGFDAILDPEPDGTINAQRVFPPPSELWFEAGIDYSSIPYKLIIEGPAALASTPVLRAAVSRAIAMKRKDGFVDQHPLVRARQIGPASASRTAARAVEAPARVDAMRRARAWHDNGEKPVFIACRLGRMGYRISERTVRRWLDPNQVKFDTSSGQDEEPVS